MRMTLFLTFLLVNVFGFVWIAETCRCMPTHPQIEFCKADFVLRGTILSDRIERTLETKMSRDLGIPAPKFVHYNALVSRVYKGFKKMTTVIGKQDSFLFRVPIHIALSGVMCNFEFKKNTKYLIMGRIVAGMMQVTHCSFVQPLNEVSHEVRRGINGNYNCDCKVQLCFDGFCERHENVCKWQMKWDGPIDECTVSHRSCQQVDSDNKKNQCQWREDTKPYNECVKRNKVASTV